MLRVTGFCVGNSPVTGEFPAQGPVTRKMFPFDDVNMNFGWKTVIDLLLILHPVYGDPNNNNKLRTGTGTNYFTYFAFRVNDQLFLLTSGMQYLFRKVFEMNVGR